MGPLRILILAALLYIGYRLIMSNFRKSTDDSQDKKSGGTGGAGEITDVLVEDPVCGKLVPQKQAHELKIDDETHFFCSKECADTYVSEKGDDA